MQPEVLDTNEIEVQRSARSGDQKARAKTYEKAISIDPIAEGLKLASPAWPLQSTVAVNPFWFLRDKSFDEVAEVVSPATHAPIYMPLEYYRERMRDGRISDSALKQALEEAHARGVQLPSDLDKFKRFVEESKDSSQRYQTFAECMGDEGHWSDLISTEIGKYASGYLDDSQAIAPFPWRGENFWNAWCQAIRFDRSMEASGVTDFHDLVVSLNAKSSAFAIEKMCREMGVLTHQAQSTYVQRLVATVLGWMTQFKYSEWQQSLGYSEGFKISSIDLLAVAMAYDFGVFRFAQAHMPMKISAWYAQISRWDSKHLAERNFSIHCVLQSALEKTYQKFVASEIAGKRLGLPSKPKAQMVFCIDVRSEMLRRQIEQLDSKIQTVGFAGFFGLPIDYKKIGEKSQGHRLPVLLKSEYEVQEVFSDLNTQKKQGLFARVFADSYFRNLRKNAFTSFVYVELFGIFYVFKMIQKTLKGLFGSNVIPAKFETGNLGPSQAEVRDTHGELIDLTKKIDRAAAILGHMGLKDQFAELVFLVGHGSETTNNAFASALDCGACGGHAGDVNARFLADLLNDRLVREGLKRKGVLIPDSTTFVAAIHETVTDEFYILDREKISLSKMDLIEEIEDIMAKASQATRDERQGSLTERQDASAFVRSKNWAEVRPEWGLAGNACFVVAPRVRTRGVNLASRSFLHDYDWKKDEITGFKTLELIMTAPMVVTNWINMQYYASTVAPRVYGSGNKILHNITNECGVVEGNGGDLRVGLPIQSVHDGVQFVHEPLRLSVFIEAPVEQIERIVARHEVVRQLVDNEWLHLLNIDSVTGEIRRRLKGGRYMPI